MPEYSELFFTGCVYTILDLTTSGPTATKNMTLLQRLGALGEQLKRLGRLLTDNNEGIQGL